MRSELDLSTSPRLGLLGWGLLLSLLTHAVLLFLKFSFWRTPDLTAVTPQTIPIEIADIPPEYLQPQATKRPPVPKPDSREKQIVESEDAANRDIDPDAKYLSDKNQKAEEQTKAQMIDDFQKKQGTGSQSEKTADRDTAPAAGGEDSLASGSDGIVPGTASTTKKDWRKLSLQDLSVGGDGGMLAATDDNLDGVQDGQRTILSTREFKFFSYYHRIKELLRQYWKPNVERKLAKVWSRGRTISQDELVTKVLVLLDERGGIQKISRVSSSGIDELDDAAVEAFNRAGPFPNPPKGMVDADGFVRIRWDFILKTESGPRIQFRAAGPQHNVP